VGTPRLFGNSEKKKREKEEKAHEFFRESYGGGKKRNFASLPPRQKGKIPELSST